MSNKTTSNLYNSNKMDKNAESHLNWIYERLVHVHGENPNLDYMIKFREFIDNLSKQREFNRMELISKMANKPKRPKTNSSLHDLNKSDNLRELQNSLDEKFEKIKLAKENDLKNKLLKELKSTSSLYDVSGLEEEKQLNGYKLTGIQSSTKYNYLVIIEPYEKIIKTGKESPEELNELHSERREVFEEMFSEFDKVILYSSDSEKETKFQVLTVEK